MAQRQYTDADQLFGDLYIDVQTAPCQLTSRIKQAIGSVQTFVQRTMLGLEPSAKLAEEAAREWSWRKSYRVWEANRKIFLYPENWIYPELRDDKSPFFKQLESDLRQKDLTDDVAEDAFARYLESLEEVAKLEVVAVYHQKDDGDDEHDAIDVLHVVGRTRLEPNRHFYRTRVDGSYWTSWEPIELDIDADHLVLTVVNRRIHLFWPVFETKPDEKQPGVKANAAGPAARKHVEIRLAWSELHHQKWSARRVSKGDPITFSPSVDPRRFTFVASTESAVHCLLNPGLWLPGHRGLFRLGHFEIQACGGQVQSHNRGLTFENEDADLKDLDALAAKTQKDASNSHVDLAQLTKDLEALNKLLQKVNADPAALAAEINAAQSDEVMLTLPALTVRVYQDDTQIPDTKIDPSMPDAQDKDTLTVPVALDAGSQLVTVLGHAPTRFRVLAPHNVNYGSVDTYAELDPLFYKDDSRTFFAELKVTSHTEWLQGSKAYPGLTLGGGTPKRADARIGPAGSALATWAIEPPEESLFAHTYTDKGYRFWNFYHPHACDFLAALRRGGVAGLLSWPAQKTNQNKSIQFASSDQFSAYQPNAAIVNTPYPLENVDFSFGGPYARYNWEVFFHIPYLVATRLLQNQRFEEAQKWFHYMFDPSSGGAGKAPQRFWKVKPFFENDNLATIQEDLAIAAQVTPGTSEMKSLLGFEGAIVRGEIDAQIDVWKKNPFNPHAIARLRPLAYQKAVVMKYLENLIAWGDQLFRRDTLEAINEATQLYILASQILGARPVAVHPPDAPPARTYAEIEALDLGPFSDPVVPAEALVTKPVFSAGLLGGFGTAYEPPPDVNTLLFCIPPDDMLLGLWDTVADRLFKLRHCMNIDGVVRQLPLFEPPIDPALLVQAAAAGVDLTSALDDMSPILPAYRFSVMHAKAVELASGVSALGGAFLAALEKRDAEGLARLRSGQEIDLLTAVREVKAQQLRETQETRQGLDAALEIATVRRDYYAGLPKVSAGEILALETSQAGMIIGTVAQAISSGASSAHAVPTVTFGVAGWAGSPMTVTMAGGEVAGTALDSAAHGMSVYAGMLRDGAATQGTLAGYDRRWDEWKFQQRLAEKEIRQIGKQIAAADIRVAIAEKDLENHDLQIQHAREVGDYLRDKLTNEELYDWMSAELSTVYFQTYKLAYDTAKRAEKAYRYERAVETSSYVTFGYWDSLKRGLLAGERLQHDLRRLEGAYLEQNVREFEITRHVSLAALRPDELMALRETGTCTIHLDEKLFDLDYPGHYLRRIKSVSVTIPAVNGPYTGVNCTMRLASSSVRKSTKDAGSAASYARSADDSRFADGYVPVTTTIVTSSAQNDGGVFELNFRDERYLPFEGAGAMGTWNVSLPKATNGFDVSMVSDLILHVRYTARYGGDAFRDAVTGSVVKAPRGGQRLFSLRTEFPEAWERFMNPDDALTQVLNVDIDASAFPYLAGNAIPAASRVTIYARWSSATAYLTTQPLTLDVAAGGASSTTPVILDQKLVTGSVSAAMALKELTPPPASVLGSWKLSVQRASLGSLPAGLFTAGPPGSPSLSRLDDTLQDVWVLVEHTQTVP
jgi:hypothetical protein